jgi:hypothetical protein
VEGCGDMVVSFDLETCGVGSTFVTVMLLDFSSVGCRIVKVAIGFCPVVDVSNPQWVFYWCLTRFPHVFS